MSLIPQEQEKISNKLKQSYVTIVGREKKFLIDEKYLVKGITSSPPFIDSHYDKKSKSLIIRSKEKGRGFIELETDGGNLSLPIVSFAEREVFLITALCCNYHTGWNPALHDRLSHPQCCGPDKQGNAFLHIKNMEQILHNRGFPITWFIDPRTAHEEKNFFLSGREKFRDEIAFMPSSYSHFNPVNYNLEKTLEETLDLLKCGISELENIFNSRVTTVAIDQFIGSVGTNFVNASAELGVNALWGMGFDHGTCDTSMFHSGCPWNPYRPSIKNFRIPSRNPLPLWLFQWTFRDLINTVHTTGGASGAVMFSTDVDDILCTLIAENQNDYYKRIALELLKNKSENEMIVLTIHQEDHDSWNKKGCDYYEQFFTNLPEGFTPATMSEVADWLDLKYPYPFEPEQCLRLEDPLICKDKVLFIHPDVKKPADWQMGGSLYPPHIFYYNSDFQIIFIEKSPIPFRFIDYRKEYDVPENGVYPPEKLPEVIINSLKIISGKEKAEIQYDIKSDREYKGYPIAIWTDKLTPENHITIPGGFIIFIDLKKGINRRFYQFCSR